MEKILINSVEQKFGKPNAQGVCTPFWAVKFNHGDSATVWDETIGNHMIANIGTYVEAEISLAKNGVNKNIREVAMGLTTDKPEPVIQPETKPMPQAKEKPNPQRVGLYIKLAVEMMIAAPVNGKNVEENLCENIQEIKKLEEFTTKLLMQ